jgi:DNA-binding CsgD family transcriptional regulator
MSRRVPLAERLAAKTQRGGPDDCWPFTGDAQTRSGHRQIWRDGRMVLAHRVAWEQEHGPIPDGQCVCHRCDNPPCVNPAHLFLGTVADNNADRDSKGRGVLPRPEQVKRRPAGPVKHGTLTGYVKRKCRCADCRAANSQYRSNRHRAAAVTRGAAKEGEFFPGSRRRPIEHGTVGGYRAHYRHGEPMCDPCRAAERKRLGHAGPQKTAQCGTVGGYARHLRRGEKTCAPCRRAQAEQQDRYLRRQRGDVWPYEHLVPVVVELTARGVGPDEIAEQLNVSRLRVGRALARAERSGLCPPPAATTRPAKAARSAAPKPRRRSTASTAAAARSTRPASTAATTTGSSPTGAARPRTSAPSYASSLAADLPPYPAGYPLVDGRAPCRSGDPERFFPPPDRNPKIVEAVLDECRGCPFTDPCAAWALLHEDFGIWGATTAVQRRRARKRLGIVLDTPHAGSHAQVALCGTTAGDDDDEHLVDELAIEAVLHGHRMRLTGATLHAAVHALAGSGHQPAAIAERLGIQERQAQRLRDRSTPPRPRRVAA